MTEPIEDRSPVHELAEHLGRLEESLHAAAVSVHSIQRVILEAIDGSK